ncbi:MAG TPA: RnfABCDGE type electron transport complex subunit D [Candidatus Binatia bacterium]|jgi:Na+-transporting NADH:ubiquinone oxidoreductase subunit NqrB
MPMQLSHVFPSDPRYYQIAVLTSLLIYGVGWLGFDVGVGQIAILLGSVLLTQFLYGKFFAASPFDPRSALISGLSLCLLLRTNSPLLMIVTAVVTIASKFLIKWNHKHIFNPTNFGIVTMIALSGEVWVSPAQWGSKLYFGFLMACLGGMVVHRALRSDVSYAFICSYAAILFGRAFWLGDPWAIPLKQLQSGALLLFTFFMISDPKTTPDSRAGRILFAIIVAAGTAYVQFSLYRTNGLLWSLVACSALTPLIDYLLPGTKYQWNSPNTGNKGEVYAKDHLVLRPVARPIGYDRARA